MGQDGFQEGSGNYHTSKKHDPPGTIRTTPRATDAECMKESLQTCAQLDGCHWSGKENRCALSDIDEGVGGAKEEPRLSDNTFLA
jgi:hypothetical protein